MRDLLIATTNPGKIREIRPVLAGILFRLITLADIGRKVPEPDETGATFAENARLKADYYAANTGLMTVAEDSGLAVDALNGRPGIHSARYPGGTYPEKFANLYRELALHSRPWTAHYVCALSLVQGPESGVQGQSSVQSPGSVQSSTSPGSVQSLRIVQDPLFECDGVVDGEIWPEPRGTNGFGYDPIFYFPEFNATFGEMDDTRKSTVAHRGRAFRLLRDFLLRSFPHGF